MSKRILSIVSITIMLVLCMSCVTLANEEPTVTVFVDGEQLAFDVEPIIESGRTLVPMRFIFEVLGATVEWIDETSTAVAIKDDIKIEITIDSNQMLKNNEIVELDVPAKLINGRTLVPVRAVSEGLGAKVDWDGELFEVIITRAETPADDEGYDISELSPGDTEKLKADYDMLRYVFEQQYLPNSLFESPKETGYILNNRNEKSLSIIKEGWNNFLIYEIMELQVNSEDIYYNSEVTVEELIEKYYKVLRDVSMDADSIFEVTYEKTPNGKNLMLLNFNDTKGNQPSVIKCKYIGIVLTGETFRYYTVERSPLAEELYGKEMFMLCEITESNRENYGVLNDIAKETFLKEIDETLK